ncbi:MAG: hypothetical protein ACYDG0_05475 [Vulcanimicrobiaceae bacterium]
MRMRQALAALLLAGSLSMLGSGMPAAAATQPAATSSQLLGALKNMSAELAKFRGMMGNLTQSELQIVDVATVLAPGGEATFQRELKTDAAHISGFHETLSHTTFMDDDGVTTLLPTFLKAQKPPLTVGQFVAVHVTRSGQILLFYQ